MQRYNQVYFFDNLLHWNKETTLERRYQSPGGDKIHLVGWHDVVYYANPPPCRSQFYVAIPSWWSEYKSPTRLYMQAPFVFGYQFVFTLQATRKDFMSRVAVFECCVISLISFLFLALFAAPSGMLKNFPEVSNVNSEGVLLPILLVYENLLKMSDSSRLSAIVLCIHF